MEFEVDSGIGEKLSYLLAPDRLVLLVVRDGEGEIRELNCSPCPSQHNLWSCNATADSLSGGHRSFG